MPRKFWRQVGGRVAGDQAREIKLLAAILLLELATDQVASDFDFNELRPSWGADSGPIDPSQAALAELPLPRMGRIDVKKLSDDQLVDLYRRATITATWRPSAIGT